MKIKAIAPPYPLLVIIAVFVAGDVGLVGAQTTAFTYQGRLTDNGLPASGNYDLRFRLYDAATSGGPVGDAVTNENVLVNNGLASVMVDFGANVFTGADRWLEVAVRTNGASTFATLNPRQRITPTPYAITAYNVAGTVPGNSVSGTYSNAVTFNNPANSFSGSGAGLSNVNAATLSGLGASDFWKLGGNAGTAPGSHFIGTSDNEPIELKANGIRALRLEPTVYEAPNVIGGAPVNHVAAGVIGATIGGGGAGNYFEQQLTNEIAADFAVIAGGIRNRIGPSASGSVISGGNSNIVESEGAFIAGGVFNALGRDAIFSTISGGELNVIEQGGQYSTISGGRRNMIHGSGTIGGGSFNFCRAGTIAGGSRNKVDLAANATIAGGQENEIGLDARESIIGGGNGNKIEYGARESVVAGGHFNTIHTNAFSSTIGGGAENHILPYSIRSTIAGGAYNTLSGFSGTIAGGMGNSNRGDYATIPGGLDNAALHDFTFAAGRRAKAHHRGAFVWGDSIDADINSTATNQFTVRASGGVRFFANTTASVGVALASGANSWSSISDRNAKKNFQPVNKQEILEKVAQLQVQRWNYKGERDADVPHIGPMAQDFKAAFYPGRDDTCISTMEFDGVELAAIQGLNEKLRDEAKEKDARIAALEKRLQEVEVLVRSLARRTQAFSTDQDGLPLEARRLVQ